MIKTYCIITPQVSNMGGAQLYCLRRVNYLLKNGYNVKLIVGNDENFILENEFKATSILKIDEITEPLFIVSRQKTQQILSKIKEFLRDEDVIFESHLPALAIWGELIAKELKSKHIIYFLIEVSIKDFRYFQIKDYFIWKLKRNECYGVSNISLKLIFGEYFDEKYNNYINIGFDINELTENTNPDFLKEIPPHDFIIGTVARLSKTYITELINSSIKLSLKYPDLRFLLIIAGNDPDASILSRLRKKYLTNNNFSILFPGYINPIGKDFFRYLDVFVGMGTASVNSIAQKCATINIDPRTNLASGIFGVNNFNFAYDVSGTSLPIHKYLEKFIDNENLIEQAGINGYNLYKKEFDLVGCMNKFDFLIKSSNSTKKYWSFSNSYINNNCLKVIKYNFIKTIFFSKTYPYYRIIKNMKN